MSDVKNIITRGIGAGPGAIHFFVLEGLDTQAATGVVDLTVRTRSAALTLESRSTRLNPRRVSRNTITLEDR